MNIRKEKEKQRRRYLRIRRSIPADEYEQYSERIIGRLREWSPFKQAEKIHCYVSLNERGEVNTSDLIREMDKGAKQVIVPVTDFDTGTLKHIELTGFEDLRPNRWGVPEPETGREVSPGELDLVIVPMVAGDLQRNRLGYGKGFYDRFLSEVECPAAGLVFERCLADELPVEPFDVRLDVLITEERIIGEETGS